MLAFLETSLKVDASGLNIGGGSNNTLTASLTIDARSTLAALTSFSASIPNNVDSSVPFTATVAKVNSQLCTLTLIFAQPVANVHFGEIRVLTITGSNADTYSLNLEVNYANNYNGTNWINSSASLSVDDIDLRAPFTSITTNNRLRSLLSTALTALNQAKNYIKYYGYKEKYLTDIIDFAIAAGSSFESSNSTIAYNSDGNITSIITSYSDSSRLRTQKIRITYTYGNYTITRLRRRDTVYTDLQNTTMSLLNSFIIEALDNTNNLIYTLGTIAITRSVSPTIYSVLYLADYNSTLPIETINTDPGNLLSDYKYFKTNTITGWTVVV